MAISTLRVRGAAREAHGAGGVRADDGLVVDRRLLPRTAHRRIAACPELNDAAARRPSSSSRRGRSRARRSSHHARGDRAGRRRAVTSRGAPSSRRCPCWSRISRRSCRGRRSRAADPAASTASRRRACLEGREPGDGENGCRDEPPRSSLPRISKRIPYGPWHRGNLPDRRRLARTGSKTRLASDRSRAQTRFGKSMIIECVWSA